MRPPSHRSCTNQEESPWPNVRPNRSFRERFVDVAARSPADGDFVGIVPAMTTAVVQAVAQLRSAKPAWEAMGFARRRIGLERFRDWSRDKDGNLLCLVHEEWGDSLLGVTVTSADVPSCSARHAEKFLAPGNSQSHGLTMVTERMGVVRHPHRPVRSIIPRDSQPATQMLGIPAAWMTRCVALNVMPDQVNHQTAMQSAFEICCYSTKAKDNRPISRFCAVRDASYWNVAPQLALIETQP